MMHVRAGTAAVVARYPYSGGFMDLVVTAGPEGTIMTNALMKKLLTRATQVLRLHAEHVAEDEAESGNDKGGGGV